MKQSNQKQKNNLAIFYWMISPEELKNQVDNYFTLPVWKSYKGQIVIAFIFFLILGMLVSATATVPYDGDVVLADILYALILYIPVLFFVYKGHRWAMIALMVIWTAEQLYKLILTEGGGAFSVLIFWYIIILFLYKAIKIENARLVKNNGGRETNTVT